MAARIVKRIGALLLIYFVLEFLYFLVFYEKDFRSNSPELYRLQHCCDSVDIYYFGESSNNTYAAGDSAQNSISEFAARFYPGVRVLNINKNASHAGIYRAWLRQIEKCPRLPEALVVTMNLRSFNAQWIHSDLETPLREALVFGYPFPPLLNRFLLSLQAFDNKSLAEREDDVQRDWTKKKLFFPYPVKYESVKAWDNAMANGGYLKPDGTWDQEKIVLACHYIKAYAFNLNSHNPRVRDFDAIAAWAERHKVPVYFNLMAENLQYADSLVGQDLLFLMRQNRDFLVKRYQKGRCKVVDNLESVKGKEFIDQNWTTEHYTCRARMRIAKNLADTMKTRFKKNYREAY